VDLKVRIPCGLASNGRVHKHNPVLALSSVVLVVYSCAFAQNTNSPGQHSVIIGDHAAMAPSTTNTAGYVDPNCRPTIAPATTLEAGQQLVSASLPEGANGGVVSAKTRELTLRTESRDPSVKDKFELPDQIASTLPDCGDDEDCARLKQQAKQCRIPDSASEQTHSSRSIQRQGK
jgi:hypothetical protein